MHIGLSSVVRANAVGGGLASLRIAEQRHSVRALRSAQASNGSADLKEAATIGISSLGSESDATITIMLAKLGMTRADVTIKELGTRRLAAIQSGAVAATALNEPDRSLAYAAGLTALIDLAPQHIPWLFTALVAKRADITGRRELLTRFLKATIEGNRLAIADETRAKAVLKREFRVNDQRIIDLNYVDFKEQTPANAEIDIQGARAIIEQISNPGASRALEDYVDVSLLNALEAEGFFDATARK